MTKNLLLKSFFLPVLILLSVQVSLAQQVFINELHYDNEGTDAAEGIEIAGPADSDLSGWSLVLYNGSNGATYNTIPLQASFTDQTAGWGFAFYNLPVNGLQNGSPDGLALVDNTGAVVQFLSYEGVFTATNGPAIGMQSVDIGVSETSSSPAGSSLQLSGIGEAYTDFTWSAPAPATPNAPNQEQQFTSGNAPANVVFINEFHYDNASGDVDEGIELAGTAGHSLAGYTLVLYNGNNGAPYNTLELSGTFPDQDGGYGTLPFLLPVNGLQNGAPDGMALVDADGSVLQFLSYEGSFTAVGGPADGMSSTDIGVAEDGTTPLGHSLQLVGEGTAYEAFTWAAPMAATFGSINTGQSFGGVVVVPQTDTVDIATARALSLGREVIVCGVLTATDQFGGPAFIQDKTGGIALFDAQVHAAGLFQIGDSLCVKASIGAFNQQVQLVNVSELTSYGPALEPILPIVVSLADLASVEGQLVTLENVTFTTEGLLFPNSNYAVTDGTSTADVRIDAEVESLVGKQIPEGAVSVTGVVASFRGSMQLQPRFAEDLPAATPYVPAGDDIARSTTLDIATWNMEFFGATQNNFGPNDEALQLENAKKVLMALDADIIAVQEISDEAFLGQLVAQLPGNWSISCSSVYSYSYQPADPNFPPQQLCYIYNTDVVSVLEERVMFDEFYTTLRTTNDASLLPDYPTTVSSFWASGRLPYLLKVASTVEGVTEELVLVNIHAIANSGGAQSYYRRTYDVQVLKDSLDTYYGDAQVVLLGDYNDDVDEPVLRNAPSTVSPYAPFVNSPEYYVPTLALSEAGFRSYVTQENVIDHITISDELVAEYIEGSEQVFIPFNLISNYVNTTSDHMPVLVRFELFEPLVASITGESVVYSGYAPEACTTLTAAATGGKGEYTYLWSTGDTSASINVCPAESTTYTLTVFDAVGNSTTESFSVCAIDVSCGDEKIKLCWQPNPANDAYVQLCLPLQLADFFLKRGASLGHCFAEEACTEDDKATAARMAPASTAAVRHMSLNSALSVSPSLVREQAKVDFVVLEEGATTLQVYSAAGQLMATIFKANDAMGTTRSAAFNVAHYKAGLYLVKMTTASGEVFTAKFVVSQ